jgi:VanZ family protein
MAPRSAMLLRWVFWACVLALLVLSLMPPVPQMPSTGWDKSNHALGFAALMLLGRWAYPDRTAAMPAGLLGYGALIEVLQSLTPYRMAEWADLFADGLGLLAGWAVALAMTRLRAWLGDARKSADE